MATATTANQPKGKREPATAQAKGGQPPLKIEHPEVEVHECWLGREGPITSDMAKQILGWEDEETHKANGVAAALPKKKNPESFAYGDDYLLKDENGLKIRCRHNFNNRPYDDNHARSLAQDVLNRNWAGPTTMPGETVNGEGISVSRTAQVLSGQHRLIGLILACQIWKGPQHEHWVERGWETEPVLESLVLFGISDSAAVLRTIDNVKERTEADVFYTSELFRKESSVNRKLLSLMLAKAADFLWKRTREEGKKGDGSEASFSPYRTHSEALAFVERHKAHLIECLHHLFNCNKERVVSDTHRLSPGLSAGIMFLMGSCGSDVEAYREMERPSEKKLDWKFWNKAMEFWTLLSTRSLPVVTEAIQGLKDADNTLGGRLSEKLAVLSRAWDLFRQGRKLEKAKVVLDEDCYMRDVRNGNLHLIERSDFGGIDIGEEGWTPPKEDDPKEIEKRKKEEDAKRNKVMADKVEAARLKKEGKGNGEAPRPDLAPNPPGVIGPRKPPAPKPLSRPLHKRDDETSETVAETTAPKATKPTIRRPLGANPTRKQVEAEQTRRAKEADEELARQRATGAEEEVENPDAEEQLLDEEQEYEEEQAEVATDETEGEEAE